MVRKMVFKNIRRWDFHDLYNFFKRWKHVDDDERNIAIFESWNTNSVGLPRKGHGEALPLVLPYVFESPLLFMQGEGE